MARWFPIRKVSRSRLDRSAQWASSITSTTGDRLPSCSSAPSIPSNSAARAAPGSPSEPTAPSSGSSRASSRVARPGSIAVNAAAPMSWTRSRSIAVNGPNGSPSVPSCRQPPVSTRAPASRAAALNSLISLDLPTPASPPSSTVAAPPWRTLSKAPSRAVSCSARPIRTGLEARPLIVMTSKPAASGIPAAPAGAGAISAVTAVSRGATGGRERLFYIVGDYRDQNALLRGGVPPGPPGLEQRADQRSVTGLRLRGVGAVLDHLPEHLGVHVFLLDLGGALRSPH